MSCTPAVSTCSTLRAVDLVGSGQRGLREQMGTHRSRFLDGAGGTEDDSHLPRGQGRGAAAADAGAAATTGIGSIAGTSATGATAAKASAHGGCPPLSSAISCANFHGICQTRFTRIPRLPYVVGRNALVVEGMFITSFKRFSWFQRPPYGIAALVQSPQQFGLGARGAAARDDFIDAGAAARHADRGLVAARVHAGGRRGRRGYRPLCVRLRAGAFRATRACRRARSPGPTICGSRRARFPGARQAAHCPALSGAGHCTSAQAKPANAANNNSARRPYDPIR